MYYSGLREEAGLNVKNYPNVSTNTAVYILRASG
jgi:hypothetical protein